jgi:hypothetical protein
VSLTKSVAATRAYDDLKVQAILNQVSGRDHTGGSIVGVPILFGMNLQAVSVAQRLREDLSINISTNNLVVGASMTLTDAQANRFANRFYRALLPPKLWE